jgi:hypothetical protein
MQRKKIGERKILVYRKDKEKDKEKRKIIVTCCTIVFLFTSSDTAKSG